MKLLLLKWLEQCLELSQCRTVTVTGKAERSQTAVVVRVAPGDSEHKEDGDGPHVEPETQLPLV